MGITNSLLRPQDHFLPSALIASFQLGHLLIM
jgi:hypothetical protein